MRKIFLSVLSALLVLCIAACSSAPDGTQSTADSSGQPPAGDSSNQQTVESGEAQQQAAGDVASFNSADFSISPELSSDPFSGQIQLIDKVYTLPFRVQELLDDGWIDYQDKMDLERQFDVRGQGVIMLQYMVDGKPAQIQLTFICLEDEGAIVKDCAVYQIECSTSSTYQETADSELEYFSKCPAAFPGGISSYDDLQKMQALYPDAEILEGSEATGYNIIERHGNVGYIGFMIYYAKIDTLEYAQEGELTSWSYRTLSPFTSLGNGEYALTEYPY